MKEITAGIIGALLAAVMLLALSHYWQDQQAPQALGGNLELGVCEVTETTVTIGHQAPTTVLAEDPSRQWAIIQQPLNATNTVSLSLEGAAVSGQGYLLPPATTTFQYGFSTDIRSGNALSAITSTGSTTINVLDCN